MTTPQKITTSLMFTGQAEEAITFYMSLFPNSEIVAMHRNPPTEENKQGTVMHATFSLNGQQFMCIDSPPVHAFTFTPAMSLYITCETEEEVDHLFNQLSQGGMVMMPLGEYPFSKKYAWISDRFGVSWQLTYHQQ